MGSALAALEGRDKEIGADKIFELTKACDEWLELPPREFHCVRVLCIVLILGCAGDLDKPFLLPVEGKFTFTQSAARIV